MAMQFEKPLPGSTITVYFTVHCFDHKGQHTTRIESLSGLVIQSDNWQDPNSFALQTDNRWFPISVIDLKSVTNIQYASGEEGTQTTIKELPTIQNWSVKSSNPKKPGYTVSLADGKWACSCPGFQFRRECRHINDIKVAVSAS